VIMPLYVLVVVVVILAPLKLCPNCALQMYYYTGLRQGVFACVRWKVTLWFHMAS